MNVLLAQPDEKNVNYTKALLKECLPAMSLNDCLKTTQALVKYLRSGPPVDLLVLDTDLAQGSIFNKLHRSFPHVPVIFIASNDSFALSAFKFNSVDYLLKPLRATALKQSLAKYNHLYAQQVEPAVVPFVTPYFRERFIIKAGNKLQFKITDDVAYFFADGKVTYLVTKKDNRRYIIDHTLEQLEDALNPKQFFRIHRKFILAVNCIDEVKGLISGKFQVKLTQPCEHELLISRDRVSEFKKWLDF